MRSLFVAVGLTVGLSVSSISSGFAGSAEHYSLSSDHRAQASYRTNASPAPVSRASETPPNCVREACGRLWCWNMGKTTSNR